VRRRPLRPASKNSTYGGNSSCCRSRLCPLQQLRRLSNVDGDPRVSRASSGAPPIGRRARPRNIHGRAGAVGVGRRSEGVAAVADLSEEGGGMRVRTSIKWICSAGVVPCPEPICILWVGNPASPGGNRPQRGRRTQLILPVSNCGTNALACACA
jgi:hypothetical protein